MVKELLIILGMLVFSFISGSIPFGFIFAKKIKNVDLRKIGSGNIGATNVARALGLKLGILVLLLDALKGAIPTFCAAEFIGGFPWLPYLVAIFSVLGHIFSPFINFKGGKGVATAFGTVCILFPVQTLIAVFLFITISLITRIVSLASLGATTFVWYIVLITGSYNIYAEIFVMVALLMVFISHRSNISRIFNGKENIFRI